MTNQHDAGGKAIFLEQADGRVVLRNVTVRYGRRLALESITGEFASGSLTAVVGANGAGKSTLLAAIAGTVRLAGGMVDCPARASARLAYLPQLAAIDADYPLTVAELIALGGWREFGAFRAPGAALRSRAAAAAATVGLGGTTGTADRRTVGGRIAAGAVRTADAAGRGGDPARRAVRRGRCADHVGAARSGRALARRRAAP